MPGVGDLNSNKYVNANPEISVFFYFPTFLKVYVPGILVTSLLKLLHKKETKS